MRKASPGRFSEHLEEMRKAESAKAETGKRKEGGGGVFGPAFGVPPLGGFGADPPKGGTPNPGAHGQAGF